MKPGGGAGGLDSLVCLRSSCQIDPVSVIIQNTDVVYIAQTVSGALRSDGAGVKSRTHHYRTRH